jgi:cytochrome c-type biogenesis protein CcmH
MTLFWILAAGLMALALAFILPPLLSKKARTDDPSQDALNLAVFRRQLQELDADLAAGELEQAQYETARRDLEMELLHDVGEAPGSQTLETGGGRWAAGLLAIAVPALAVVLYLTLGSRQIIPLLETAASTQAPDGHASPDGKMPPLEVMIQRLAAKLEQHPDNLEGWVMLGRTYFAIGKPERALSALEKAYKLAPENPDVLALYAEALAANQEGKLAGRPAQLVQTALKIDPRHSGARWLEGLGYLQAGEYRRAAEHWEALLPSFDPGSEEAAELQGYIDEARSRAASASSAEAAPEQHAPPAETPSAGEKTPPPASAAAPRPVKPPAPAQGAAIPGVQVEVSLADSLRSRVDPNDILFIYAKAVSGPPMPLAARRARAGDLPLSLTLDDSMAVMPTMKLSQFRQVTVGARISKSGRAMPQSGDIEGEVSPVETGQASKVKILIDRVRP